MTKKETACMFAEWMSGLIISNFKTKINGK